MVQNVFSDHGVDAEARAWIPLGEALLEALVAHDFPAMENLIQPDVRFRAILPSRFVEVRDWIQMRSVGSSAGLAAAMNFKSSKPR